MNLSHTDHIVGNCVFSEDTSIISSKQVKELFEDIKKEFEAEKGQYQTRIREIEGLLNSKSGAELEDLNNELKFLTNLVKPEVKIRIPNRVIENEFVIKGSTRSLHLFQYDIAHSTGDIAGYLPEDDICFTGDLLFAESHPWIGSGNPESLINALERLLKYNIKYYVPGHGQLAAKEDVLLELQYLNEIIELVRSKKSLNVSDYDIDELSTTFREWKSLCFSWNLNFLIERIKDNK